MSRSLSSSIPSRLPHSLPPDILAFLQRYPRQRPDPSASLNAHFYQGQAAARPSRLKVDALQDELRGNWSKLESNHAFVQWLFPIREQGVNHLAQPLQPHEIATIRQDSKAMARLVESYKIMLAFYGLRLVDAETGELALEDSTPAPSPASYLRRFANLESHTHNFLRITRILKCMGEFGLDQHPPSFLLYVLSLQASPSSPHLTSASLVRSIYTYWRWCVRDDVDRDFVRARIDGVRDGSGSWSEGEYREWVERRAGERNGATRTS
ncbi:hypothetical protein JCM10212_003776 [Sporobolomyces blumeae]